MEYYKNELCVTYEELTSGDDPVVKYETLKSNIARGNIRAARSGGGEGSYALIVYSSLPGKYKARFVAKYGIGKRLRAKDIEAQDVRQQPRHRVGVRGSHQREPEADIPPHPAGEHGKAA